MYSLGSIERRLVRDDAELGREFGGRYEWMDWRVLLKALAVESTFDGDISKWNTAKVTTMNSMF